MTDAKRIIHTGRDYFEKIDGHAKVITGASGQAQQQVNARQFAERLTPESPKEDVAQLLAMIREELKHLGAPEDVKEEALVEVRAAEEQVKKPEPDKPKIAERLKGAVAALKGMAEIGTQAVAIGNMIGKAILWCGEQWTPWIP